MERKIHELDGNMQQDGIAQIKRILVEQNMTAYRMCKETGVNKETLKRMINWEETRISEFDKIGDWASDNGYSDEILQIFNLKKLLTHFCQSMESYSIHASEIELKEGIDKYLKSIGQ